MKKKVIIGEGINEQESLQNIERVYRFHAHLLNFQGIMQAKWEMLMLLESGKHYRDVRRIVG